MHGVYLTEGVTEHGLLTAVIFGVETGGRVHDIVRIGGCWAEEYSNEDQKQEGHDFPESNVQPQCIPLLQKSQIGEKV